MAAKRDWAKDVEGTDIGFVAKGGDYILCKKDGFQFKVSKARWPPKRLTAEVCLTPTEYFKFQVKEVHGDLYDLSLTTYTGADNHVEARCSEHGVFSIEAKFLKSGRGCPLCGYSRGAKLLRSSTEDFLKKAREIHGDLYDYSVTNYVTAKESVSIICKTHGEIEVMPYNHLSGRGCRLCGIASNAKGRALSQEEVVSRFKSKHGDRYDYSKTDYSGVAHGLLKITCKDHGDFVQSYANHFHGGRGCPECAREFSPRLKKGFLKSYQAKGYASLYLIRCFGDEEEFYKIGITTKKVKARFAGKEAMPYAYEVIHLHVSDGESIWDLERILHREYSQVKYIPSLPFGGMHECFREIDIQEYAKILSIIG